MPPPSAEQPADQMEPRAKIHKIDASPALHGADLKNAVREAVAKTAAIDLHTHLFPGQHSSLLLWGIDELLTYHYLVSEMFMVAPAEVTHESFFALPKSQQADLVWKHLFLERSPLSEAQLGVLTTLHNLGLSDLVQRKDLGGIREWFSAQDPLKHTDLVFKLAHLKYVVMTNIPFDEREANYWVEASATIDMETGAFKNPAAMLPQSFCSARFKTALRIDPLLKGDWGTIAASLAARGLPETLEGARAFLRAWTKVYGAEYMMASTPADFSYGVADSERQPGWPSATKLIDEVMGFVLPTWASWRNCVGGVPLSSFLPRSCPASTSTRFACWLRSSGTSTFTGAGGIATTHPSSRK